MSEKSPRMRFTDDANSRLHRVFDAGNVKPNKALREELGRQLGKSSRTIQIWFQNKRAKAKRGLTAITNSSNLLLNTPITPKNEKLALRDESPPSSYTSPTKLVHPPIKESSILEEFSIYYPTSAIATNHTSPRKLPTIITSFNNHVDTIVKKKGQLEEEEYFEELLSATIAGSTLRPWSAPHLSLYNHNAHASQSAYNGSESLSPYYTGRHPSPHSPLRGVCTPSPHGSPKFIDYSCSTQSVLTPTTNLSNGMQSLDFFGFSSDNSADLDPAEFLKWVGST